MYMSKKTTQFVIGIDEAGRGPLAGPVSISAVLMTKSQYSKFKRMKVSYGLKDSKKLTEQQREEWYGKMLEWKKEGLLSFSNSQVSAKEIDRIGIAPAIRKGLRNILRSLDAKEDTLILLDGSLFTPERFKNQNTIIKGDELESIISLASIVSKVRRDRKMVDFAKRYKKYGLEIHKGYGTKMHRDCIKKYGLSPIHRKCFCTKI